MGVREADLHRLDLQMQDFGCVHRHRSDVEVSKHAQCDQRGDALPVRRNLIDDSASIVERDGSHPFGFMFFEIVHHERAAGILRGVDDSLGEFTVVEAAATRLRDRLERACVVGKSDEVTFGGCSTITQERVTPAFRCAEAFDGALPGPRGLR